MGAPFRKDLTTIKQGGDRRSVTATYSYSGHLCSVVAPNRLSADCDAFRRWGKWDGEPVYSTPATIYNDLTGVTLKRNTRTGMYRDGAF
jgi:hypothetical protein